MWCSTVRRIVTLALSLLLAPLTADAQQARKIPLVGVLTSYSPEESHPAYALREGLRGLGYVEGQNITIEWRWARGSPERFPDLAAELVRLNVDVIVAPNNPAVQATQRATRTIPIVMVLPTDPVGLGFVASLARPGGNTTGLTSQHPDLTGKHLQLFKEVVPNVSRVAVLWNPTEPGRLPVVREAEAVAPALGMQVQVFEAQNASEIDSAFAAMTRQGADGVLVLAGTLTFAHRARIAEHAAKRRLPAMCQWREYVEAGCLMSYSASLPGLYRRAAVYVDKILKGVKPADLPVEQPMKFELVINLKTAQALGLTIPPSLLFQADEVIQ
jgi:putative ABC transport system substrate-binding protein